MKLAQIHINYSISYRLLKWSVFFILTYCTIISAEIEPKDDEETKSTLVNMLVS